eukprot:TRINITY_DN39242_c0_g1_i1.p1 TRINITY_DN39242_c0_g1~~TRINITY_DN39242_c0_g1_i1.p1  ORF type:complete len:417 (-),score=141.59 TRINITY_DN39242_c0_g1_i1:67-1317(-)
MKGGRGMKAMDLLKSALAERQAKAQKTVSETGQKWVKRSELEAKRVEEYMEEKRRDEEKWQADEDARFAKLNSHFSKSEKTLEGEKKAIPAHLLDEALLADDDAEPPLGLEEVVQRLREIGYPITLFGETDMMRYRRMRQLEKEDHEGKKNPDLVLLDSINASQRTMELEDGEEGEGGEKKDEKEEQTESSDEEVVPKKKAGKAADEEDTDSEGTGETGTTEGQEGGEGGEQEKPKKVDDDLPDVEVDLKLMDRCDFVRAWVRKTQKAWEKEIADRPEEEKKKATVKAEIAAHRQVRRDVRPLQKRLRLYVLESELLDKIFPIIKQANDREYREAASAYLDLSIGKAAWPVGIGCGGSMLMEDAIGLHDRFNRNEQVKDIAYLLNDDVTRKFVQALKRLMNMAQKFWPPDDPSNRC